MTLCRLFFFTLHSWLPHGFSFNAWGNDGCVMISICPPGQLGQKCSVSEWLFTKKKKNAQDLADFFQR